MGRCAFIGVGARDGGADPVNGDGHARAENADAYANASHPAGISHGYGYDAHHDDCDHARVPGGHVDVCARAAPARGARLTRSTERPPDPIAR